MERNFSNMLESLLIPAEEGIFIDTMIKFGDKMVERKIRKRNLTDVAKIVDKTPTEDIIKLVINKYSHTIVPGKEGESVLRQFLQKKGNMEQLYAITEVDGIAVANYTTNGVGIGNIIIPRKNTSGIYAMQIEYIDILDLIKDDIRMRNY